jgi:hypothetical protein
VVPVGVRPQRRTRRTNVVVERLRARRDTAGRLLDEHERVDGVAADDHRRLVVEFCLPERDGVRLDQVRDPTPHQEVLPELPERLAATQHANRRRRRPVRAGDRQREQELPCRVDQIPWLLAVTAGGQHASNCVNRRLARRLCRHG